MSVVLAATWYPRGELPRLRRFFPELQRLYAAMVIVLPHDVDDDSRQALGELPGVKVGSSSHWSEGRMIALDMALESDATHIHYIDLDRLVRWIETRPHELAQTMDTLQTADALIIGRTPAAQATHPQALQQTEAMSNRAVSYLLGQTLDLSSGSKGFSRRAARLLLANTASSHIFGTDAEWAVVLHRAGFALTGLLVDGLDWETADRYRDTAADAETQRLEAEKYDAYAKNWAFRVEVADGIIEAGIQAMTRPLERVEDE
jgi:hypothetical protein